VQENRVRPHLAIVGAGLFLAVAAIASAGCSRHRTTGIFVDPAFGPLVPPDTSFMAGVRLDKIRETAVYTRLKGQYDIERRMNLFAERTGLDPQKDLWQVLVVSNGDQTLVLARGKFTIGEMEPKLGALGNERTSYKDYTLIGSPQTSVVFMNPGVAIAGTQAALKHLLDHRAEYTNLPSRFVDQLKSMPAADQAWVVSTGVLPGMKAIGPDATGARSMLSNLVGYIKDLQVGFHIDEGVQMAANIDCISQEGAQRVHDAAKGALGLARMNTPDDRMQLLRLYDAVQVNQKDTQVAIEATVAPDSVDPLLKMLSGAPGQAAPSARQQ
jgi:hypothetical protein